MAEKSTREIVERYARAIHDMDYAAVDSVLADDVTDDYPQSGERVRGKANLRAIIENYPNLGEEGWRGRTAVQKVVGEEDHWVTGPGWQLLRITGTGDQFTLTGRITYPDGSVWHLVQLVELRSGKITKLTTYFGAPFEAPAWRAKWVEPWDPARTSGDRP